MIEKIVLYFINNVMIHIIFLQLQIFWKFRSEDFQYFK